MPESFPPASLPCYPCPHDAACCAYGTTLSDGEAAAIEAHFGAGVVQRMRWGEWRTRVKNKRCVLYRDGGCSAHGQPFYPVVCRGFPWTDEKGARYTLDLDICPEFTARPELVAIQRRIPSTGQVP